MCVLSIKVPYEKSQETYPRMTEPESFLENETPKILWYFQIQVIVLKKEKLLTNGLCCSGRLQSENQITR